MILFQFCNIATCADDAYKQQTVVQKRENGGNAMVICSECCFYDNCNIEGCGGTFVGKILSEKNGLKLWIISIAEITNCNMKYQEMPKLSW